MQSTEHSRSDNPLLWGAREACRQLGNISTVTLWRRVNDDQLLFPQPIKISGRNYFRADEINAWLERQASRPD